MLAQVVVDVAPDAQPFLLARPVLFARQPALLGAGAQLLLRVQAQRQPMFAPQQQQGQRARQDGAGRDQVAGRTGRTQRFGDIARVQGNGGAGAEASEHAQA